MQDYFDDIARHLDSLASGREVYTAWFEAESSDFVRFNHGRVRQPGSVVQRSVYVDLIDGQRHAAGTVTLSGQLEIDRHRLDAVVSGLRDKLPYLDADPHLLYNTAVSSSEKIGDNQLPEATGVVERVLERAGTYDFVGIYAGGALYKGFANSLGQRNWFSSHSFNLDWSLYLQGDKAVKSAYAGFTWDEDGFAAKLRYAAEQLDVMKETSKTIEPGDYDVYLAPAAVQEILSLLGWGGFGMKSHRTKQTALLKMITEGTRMSDAITLRENTAESTGPAFQASGFIKPNQVDLITAGEYRDTLCSPRSAAEYNAETNGAGDGEQPMALDLRAGGLPQGEVLQRLGTGILVNNLWYLNYSDRPAGRLTGMTRFATLWVENGEIQAPLNVMRFDDTLYRVLGENLDALTRERDFILDNDTYYQRSVNCSWVPGALVRNMRFTL